MQNKEVSPVALALNHIVENIRDDPSIIWSPIEIDHLYQHYLNSLLSASQSEDLTFAADVLPRGDKSCPN